jgi:hypothetical protein
MTLNYEPEEEPPKEDYTPTLIYLFLVRLVVGLGKTHRPALDEDTCPCLGAVTSYACLSDWTKE